MKKQVLLPWEQGPESIIGFIIGAPIFAFILWMWVSPGPPTEPLGTWDESGYYSSREDFEALVREPDEEQKALERALETLHQDR